MRVNVDSSNTLTLFGQRVIFQSLEKKRKAQSYQIRAEKLLLAVRCSFVIFLFSQLPPSVRALSPPPHRINNVFDFIKSNLLAIWPLEPFVVWFIHFFLFFFASRFFLSLSLELLLPYPSLVVFRRPLSSWISIQREPSSGQTGRGRGGDIAMTIRLTVNLFESAFTKR